MAAAERRRGRRDNGLDAADWRAVEDLDPRISEHILDLLGIQGIAAYVQPAVDVDPVTRSATLPSSPRDRLYVDRRYLSTARDSVRQFLAASGASRGGLEDPGTEIDVAFAEIVAQLDDLPAHRPTDPTAEPTAAPGAGPRADPTADTTVHTPAETAADIAGEPVEPARRTGPVDGREVTERSLLDALDTFGADLPDDEPAERFEPPPPPPLPRLSRQSFLGAVAVVAGLIMVVAQPDFLPLDGDATMLLGFATMLAGATALILRLRSGTDPDDTHHPDDGARV